MKRSILLFSVSLLLLLPSRIIPQETDEQDSKKMEACYQTLQQGLNSENNGLMAGCAYMAGEIRCQRSVVTLLKILHSNPYEELRILAALSLYKIGDPRGIFAIKQAITYDDSKRVQQMCELFYKATLQKETDDSINVALK